MKSIIQIVVFFFLFQSIVLSQNKWEYPVKPGTEKWKTLTIEERRKVQQIPENVLKKMSTEDIFQAWLDLPGRLELLAFSSLQQGFDFTVKHFNVLHELLNRNDGGYVLLTYYSAMDVNNIHQKNKDIEKGKFMTDFGFIEFILSQPQVLNNLSENDQKKLIKEVVKRFNKKRTLKNIKRDYFWEESGLVLSGRILENLRYEKFLQAEKNNEKIKTTLKLGEIHSENEYNEIYQHVMQFVKSH